MTLSQCQPLYNIGQNIGQNTGQYSGQYSGQTGPSPHLPVGAALAAESGDLECLTAPQTRFETRSLARSGQAAPAPEADPAALFRSHDPSLRDTAVSSRISPSLIRCCYSLGQHIVLPAYFQSIEVIGREHLPQTGSVILAPTHRSRWDPIMVPFAAGYQVTDRHLRFMVSADEMGGLQGWFIRRMGGFPVNTRRPQVASLRHSIEILQQGETLVIFPEGGDLQNNRHLALGKLQPGLARLAFQAESAQANLNIRIVPMNISYSHPQVPFRSSVRIEIGAPMLVRDYITGHCKQDAKQLTLALAAAMRELDPGTATAKLPVTATY
jgi:1-acyl-sn-glycerol-3-phosphate acyltransferase